MRFISTVFVVGSLLLFLGTQAHANDASHTSEAMENAGKAYAHGEDGHAKHLVAYAKKSLTHAKGAEKYYDEAHKHMSEAVKHLEHAIQHGDMGHADIATKHVDEAIQHMKESGH